MVEITEINVTSPATGLGTDKMLLAVSRGCCDASSRLNGPVFAAGVGPVTGSAYTFPVRALPLFFPLPRAAPRLAFASRDLLPPRRPPPPARPFT